LIVFRGGPRRSFHPGKQNGRTSSTTAKRPHAVSSTSAKYRCRGIDYQCHPDTLCSCVHARRKRVKRQKYQSIPEEELDNFYKRGAELLSALSDQKRLRMLKELEKEPLRQSDLSDKTDIKGGNFKHHITILKDEGLVHQEGVRERYMLTFAGREALKLAEFLYHRAKKPAGIPIEIEEEDQSDYTLEEE